MKIPWKNIYHASVEVQVEGLYLLVQPNAQVEYDEEKENKKAFEAKQAELKRVEEAKKKAAEIGIDTVCNNWCNVRRATHLCRQTQS